MILYAVQAGEGGPIKIGRTGNLKKRISAIQNGCPAKLSILAAVDCDGTRENQIHKRLAGHRLQGEWFEPAEATLAAVKDFAHFENDALAPRRPRSTLEEYLAQPGITATDLASKCGVNVSTITRAAKRTPPKLLRREIERQTDSVVEFPSDKIEQERAADRLRGVGA